MYIRNATFAALLAASPALFAQGINQKFVELDRDGNGVITAEEVASIPGYDRAFMEADENRDGRLSADEFIKSESIHQRQQAGQLVDDGVLTAKVKTALIRERGLRSRDVNVDSSRGRVLLSGFVQDEEQRRKALNVASRVPGVVEVRDGMTLR